MKNFVQIISVSKTLPIFYLFVFSWLERGILCYTHSDTYDPLAHGSLILSLNFVHDSVSYISSLSYVVMRN